MTGTVTLAVCVHCHKERRTKPGKQGGIKLPLGWKREGDAPVCHECWAQRYILRALTFPVATPVSGTWAELEQALRPLWAATTEAANWMMTQCYVRDIRRHPDDKKMPSMPRVYLYPEARILFPSLPPTTVASLEQAVQRKYRAQRWDVVWTHASSLPTMRYPQPLPLYNQSWRWWFNDHNQPMVEVRIGDKWQLRLKSGFRYRRQIAGLRNMAEQGELAIYKANDGTILVKLVGWLRRESHPPTGDQPPLLVRTAKDAVLVALDSRAERIWVENCDQIPRWIAEHRRHLQRWSEDQKAEQRPVPAFAARRRRAAEKFHQRINSAIQEIAAHVANFARRRGFRMVVYDDSERWLAEFPYAALQQRIQINLDERQIGFQKAASGEVVKQPSDPLAEE